MGRVLIQYHPFVGDIALVFTARARLQLSINTLLDNANNLGLESGIHTCTTVGIYVSRGTWYTYPRPFMYTTTPLTIVEPDGFCEYLGVRMGCETTDGVDASPANCKMF